MEDDTKTNPHSSSPLLVFPQTKRIQKGKQKKTRIKTITINIERAR